MKFLLCAILTIAGVSAVVGAEPSIEGVSYSRDVAPLLSRRCFACHGPETAESGLALNHRATVVAAAESGEIPAVPGDPGASELIRRVVSSEDGERMPPEGEPLTPAEVETLRQWIAEGAEYEKHWAFAPVTRPTVPEVRGEQWARTPIDRFILAELESAGLEPSAEADRQVLVRRLYYDLIGLPPTPEQVEAFVGDTRADAYENLVDELLASPHYGEKWARHWLDVVRYGETNSYERDDPKPNVWKYRDYVTASFNNDKPYDSFVREQLAGDEFPNPTPETITATGYYRLGVWDDEPADSLLAKYDEMDDIVSTTGQAFLGLTIGCARCHDHKIDPIPQTDYYAMVALLADVTRYGTRGNFTGNNQWDVSPPAIKAARVQLAELRRPLTDERHELEQAAIKRMDAPDQRRSETHERGQLLKEKLTEYQEPDERERYVELGDQLKRLDASVSALGQPSNTLALAKCEPEPEPTHVLMRGNPHVPGDPVEPRFPTLFEEETPEIPRPPDGARSAGRRTVLADWIASPSNRLTSRVIANRVWQHHFGRGIVRSANNFGRLGTPPTHPGLLDWLANWLVEHEWRLKPLHRLIVTSSAYRMASSPNAEAVAVDPANNLFWRFDPRRLTAEEIRDTVLTVSGQMNLLVGGPSVFPKLSDEVLSTQSRPGDDWDTSDRAAAAANRRSIYIHVKRSLIPPALAAFDFPDPDTSCEARFNTVQPAQALNLMHGQFLRGQAAALAERVRNESSEDLATRVAHTLRLVLQRPADEATIADSLDLIDTYVERHDLTPDAAFEQFCLMAMNLNEFVFLD